MFFSISTENVFGYFIMIPLRCSFNDLQSDYFQDKLLHIVHGPAKGCLRFVQKLIAKSISSISTLNTRLYFNAIRLA
jgi:hypothetical protein